MNKTKILATIGPSSDNKSVLTKMIDAGMDAIRLNTAHGSIDEFDKIIKIARGIKDLPIILDLKGPEIRINADKDYNIRKGETIRIGFDKTFNVYFNHRFEVPDRQAMLINDGMLKLKVKSPNKKYLELTAESELKIRNKVRVNIPGLKYSLPILSETDKKFMEFGKKRNIDFIALSYTRSGNDVKIARKAIGNSNIGIIAKIETIEGVKNFDEILRVADGIMVARGDLGVEIKSERLPMIQKEIIKKCNRAGKFVITATQMLQSMVNEVVPTRAETSDVANAILDGTDVLMLSGESAAGKHPVLAVREMAKIARETEPHVESRIGEFESGEISTAISKCIFDITKMLPITKVVTLTKSGYTARIISRFRLRQPIIALTPDKSVKKKLDMYYGLIPIVFPDLPTEKRISEGTRHLFRKKIISKNDMILFTAGVFPAKSGSTNLIEIHYAAEMI